MKVSHQLPLGGARIVTKLRRSTPALKSARTKAVAEALGRLPPVGIVLYRPFDLHHKSLLRTDRPGCAIFLLRITGSKRK